ncbi:MAG: hypothetical protein US31_C0002G0061 [Berkelbacteria bacterium GW2011_GWA1_36_9]|uniref:Uncharacterized protein n=1 Tax=Berkelbacteria bacterium GW2011_GWA1_36_9 TaxID=1618331 RepID=A0A0G0IRT8_9BACT|nr:MAG: hypothetical protein US31_C0002G0061 [Berkelbacteria bacterium GW2011_GWA1_36_9]
MGENLSLAENDVENKEIIFPSVLEYLSAFEQSSQFNEVLSQREKELAFDRPDINLSEEELAESTRLSFEYRKTLIDFYHDGNKLPINLSDYNEDIQKAIAEYWDFVKSMPNHINVVRATARSKDDEETKIFRMEKTRDRFHTFAGLALLGEGITLSNGQKITCDEMNPQDESAMDLEAYSVLGRTLVSIITEENGLDIADPKREETKMAATVSFLNSCRYSGGHWVAKGEK